MWCVSLELYWFKSTKFTVLLGVLSFLATQTILWHHVVGVPLGTFSMTPMASSLSRPALTSLCQWIRIGMGLWLAMGLTPS